MLRMATQSPTVNVWQDIQVQDAVCLFSFFLPFHNLVSLKESTNPCGSNPCSNNGVCTNIGSTSYQCTCNNPYYGSQCQYVSTGKILRETIFLISLFLL